MNTISPTEEQTILDLEASALPDPVEFHFQPSRRDFIQVLGAGILIAATLRGTAQAAAPARGARGGGGGGGGGIAGAPTTNLFARFHIAKDGTVTVLCGKVEGGNGARAEVTLAAAEELNLSPAKITAILSDTDLVPNDGTTAGSMTTPRTIPPIRQAAAATRQFLIGLAATALNVPADQLTVDDGAITHKASGQKKTYADLAGAQNLDQLLAQAAMPRSVTLSPVNSWKVLGKPLLRPNGRDIVLGQHSFPSDIQRPGMLFGKVLRAPGYNNTATTVDLAKAKAMKDVVVVQDGAFVGVAAPSTSLAQKALDAIDAKWRATPHPDSGTLADYFRKNATIPANRFQQQLTSAAKTLKASYFLPYIQHTPMETRAAVAEWANGAGGGKLTVWTGSQNPFGIRGELATAFNLNQANIRVIVTDFGGGFGGKHTGECAVEAARLARAAGKPVSLRYTREEEFTWAYFRPAGLIECEASLDAAGKITSWHFISIHPGPSSVQTPYAIASNTCQSIDIPANMKPVRTGSYRCLAAPGNTWARECFMDELAAAAGQDPLAFRLAHLQDPRLRAVLQAAAQRFDWAARAAKKDPNIGIGLACGTEKGGFAAACAQVTIDRAANTFKIDQLTHVFECGKILNPAGIMQQVQGNVLQSLGPALREGMIFKDGQMQNASFVQYKVPRFADVPPLDVSFLDRPDLDPAGAGEAPAIVVAPSIANALSRASGKRVRALPLKLP